MLRGWVDGEFVTTTTVTTYEDSVRWVGMVFVDVDYRRRGYGSRLLEHALNETLTGESAEIGLDELAVVVRREKRRAIGSRSRGLSRSVLVIALRNHPLELGFEVG